MSGSGSDQKSAASSSSSSSSSSTKRLSPTVWIGNISSKATEYQVLKLAEQVGKVHKFDFMYQIGSSGSGSAVSSQKVPRGYAFVTYSHYAMADEAIRTLNGRSLCGRAILVQPATSNSTDLNHDKNTVPKSLSMSMKSASGSSMSKEDKIKAMEMKLKALEGGDSQEFKVVVPQTKKHTSKPYDRPSKR